MKCRMMNRVGSMVFVIDSFEGIIQQGMNKRDDMNFGCS